VWSYLSGRRFTALKTTSSVWRVRMSASHVAAMEDTSVRVWDVDELKTGRALRFTSPLADVCFAGGMLLAAQQRGGYVRVFDPAMAGQAVVMEMHHTRAVNALACTAAGHVLSAGGAVTLWDLQYGTEITQVCGMKGQGMGLKG